MKRINLTNKTVLDNTILKQYNNVYDNVWYQIIPKSNKQLQKEKWAYSFSVSNYEQMGITFGELINKYESRLAQVEKILRHYGFDFMYNIGKWDKDNVSYVEIGFLIRLKEQTCGIFGMQTLLWYLKAEFQQETIYDINEEKELDIQEMLDTSKDNETAWEELRALQLWTLKENMSSSKALDMLKELNPDLAKSIENILNIGEKKWN